MLPQVNTKQSVRTEMKTRFLARLANSGVEQRFAGFDVARRLIENLLPVRKLLDEQEFAVFLNDRRDGQVDVCAHAAALQLAMTQFGLRGTGVPDLIEARKIVTRDCGLAGVRDRIPAVAA
jgi:hypothetical protein